VAILRSFALDNISLDNWFHWWARESSNRSRKPLKSFGRIAKRAVNPA